MTTFFIIWAVSQHSAPAPVRPEMGLELWLFAHLMWALALTLALATEGNRQ